jgi:hypothetical protein
MSTENITNFGPNTRDVEVYVETAKANPPGSIYLDQTVIAQPGPKTLRLCDSRGLENCYACVHAGFAAKKDCKVPATSTDNK